MKELLTTRDFAVSQEEFRLLYNSDLEMLVTSPQPKELGKYYQSEVYISHTDASQTITDKIYQLVKRYSLKRKLKLINQFVKTEKKILDIGAGTGDFLCNAKRKNWTVSGIEPNLGARQRAAEKGVALEAAWQTVAETKYNVITLWHVLEHLPGLEEQIKLMSSHLEESGTLIIAVPNYKSFDAAYYGNFWAGYDVPRHLWHFSKTSIGKIFAEHGFKVITTKPMIFDAFYVALLSEKYKTGKQNFLKAFWVGLKSNLMALRSKEYSSVIYCLKKRENIF